MENTESFPIVEISPIKYRNVEDANTEGEKKALIKRVILWARNTPEFWVDDFLKSFSVNTRKCYKSKLKLFFGFFPEGKHPLDMSLLQVKDVLSGVIRNPNYSLTTKQGFLSAIRQFFEGVIYDYNAILQSFGVPQSYFAFNPVPPTKRLPRFTDKEDKDVYEKTLTIPELEQCLNYINANASQPIKIHQNLQIRCGARNGEVRSTQIKDVHFLPNGRGYFESGIIEGHRKSNPRGEVTKKVVYPFNEKMAFMLKMWIKKLLAENPSEKWLFPADTETGFMGASTIDNFVQEMRAVMKRADVKKAMVSHWYRHSIINHRRTEGCDFYTSFILQYHKTGAVQIDVYSHFDDNNHEERFKKWWDYYPYPF